MTFAILYRDPNPIFQTLVEARVLYVYIIRLFISSALPRSMPWLYAQGKHSMQMVFSCQNYGLMLHEVAGV